MMRLRLRLRLLSLSFLFDDTFVSFLFVSLDLTHWDDRRWTLCRFTLLSIIWSVPHRLAVAHAPQLPSAASSMDDLVFQQLALDKSCMLASSASSATL